MLRPILLVSLPIAAMLLASPFRASTPLTLPAVALPCPNTISHEPIVLFDHSGFGVGGELDRSLVVYDDGSARLTSSFAGGVPNSKSRLVHLDPALANQLLLDLGQLGAGTLCDSNEFVSDLPPSTLTVMRGATDSRAHTFSWFAAPGAYEAIEQRLAAFIDASFPNF